MAGDVDTTSETAGQGKDASGARRAYRDVRREQHAIVRQELLDRFGENGRIDAHEDPIRWRRAVRTNPVGAVFYRTFIGVLGLVPIIAGMPDTYDCGYYNTRTCEVPGSGSGGLVGLGILLIFLSFLAAIAMAAWNRVWRVTKTGQSIGKKVTGLKVIDAESGAHPELGPAVLRELVHQFAGIISWIWMLFDDEDRTLADIVGKTHVIHTEGS